MTSSLNIPATRPLLSALRWRHSGSLGPAQIMPHAFSFFSTALAMILKYHAKERAMEEVYLPCNLSQVALGITEVLAGGVVVWHVTLPCIRSLCG